MENMTHALCDNMKLVFRKDMHAIPGKAVHSRCVGLSLLRGARSASRCYSRSAKDSPPFPAKVIRAL